jgi:hypothetical protein
VKIPDLEKLIEFTSADLNKIAQNVLKAHKDDVRKNARGPKGKFKELSNKPLNVYNGLSYKQYKQKTFNNNTPNLYASGDMFNAIKVQGKPKVGKEFSVKYGITDTKESKKLNRHMHGKGVPKRAISEKDKPIPDPAVEILLDGIASVIKKNFQKITKLGIQVVRI